MFLTLLFPLPFDKRFDFDAAFRAPTECFITEGTETAGGTGVNKIDIGASPWFADGKPFMATGTVDETSGFRDFMVRNCTAGITLWAGYLHIPKSPDKVELVNNRSLL
jgi:hypothetical protein